MQQSLGPGEGLIFRAVPEDGFVTVKVGSNGQPYYFWANALDIPYDTAENLRKRGVEFFFPSPPTVDIRGMNWIVNLCNEPDKSQSAMAALDEAFGAALPIFNHPRAIQMSRRDKSSELLRGIENLIVPKVVRFTPVEAGSFEDVFHSNGFSFPVLLRPAGSQEGIGMVKIDSPRDWTKVLYSAWQGKPHYMTQFVDYSRPDGSFSFMRIAVVGGQSFLRVTGGSQSWHIGHSHSPAPEKPKAKVDRWREVARDRDEFERWPEAKALAAEIAERVRLDFFGIDLGVIDRNRFVLFEANAAMTMTNKFALTEEARPFAERIYDDIIEALDSHIMAPEKWVYDGRFPD